MRVDGRSRLRCYSLFILVLLLGSCFVGESADVGSSPAHSVLIGQQVRLISALDAYGIREDIGDSRLSYVTLLPITIAIAGPEVAFKRRLPVGTSLAISGVKKRSTLFASDTYYVVTTDSNLLPADVEIRLELTRGNQGSGWASLNPHIYDRVDR